MREKFSSAKISTLTVCSSFQHKLKRLCLVVTSSILNPPLNITLFSVSCMGDLIRDN